MVLYVSRAFEAITSSPPPPILNKRILLMQYKNMATLSLSHGRHSTPRQQSFTKELKVMISFMLCGQIYETTE